MSIENKTGTSKSFFYELTRGSAVGGVTIIFATPLMNYLNFCNDRVNLNSGVNLTRFTFKRAFDGLPSYMSSVVPMIGVSLGTKKLLKDWTERNKIKNSQNLDLVFSAFSGAIAGLVGVLPEGIAQAQQRSAIKPSAIKVLTQVVKQNGITALTRGASPTAVRQALFTLGFMSLMPMTAKYVNKEIQNKLIADVCAAIIVGSIVGPATAPMNNLRFMRQQNFEKVGQATSYKEIFKKFSEGKGFFTGYKPRTFMTAISMFILAKGSEITKGNLEDTTKKNKIRL